jgi:hypothetical protein
MFDPSNNNAMYATPVVAVVATSISTGQKMQFCLSTDKWVQMEYVELTCRNAQDADVQYAIDNSDCSDMTDIRIGHANA